MGLLLPHLAPLTRVMMRISAIFSFPLNRESPTSPLLHIPATTPAAITAIINVIMRSRLAMCLRQRVVLVTLRLTNGLAEIESDIIIGDIPD